MKVLIAGGGGREYALAWHARKFNHQAKMVPYAGAKSIDDIVKEAKEGYDLTVVGPEQPLVDGIVGRFYKEGLPIFGPTKDAAKLEGSKIFAKELMRKYDIPTAAFGIAHDADAARKYAKQLCSNGKGAVIKADGLAAGKGVIVCNNYKDALVAIDRIMLKKEFGSAGDRVIVEERLEGEEASFIVITDGSYVLPLASSQDHKPVYEITEDRNRFWEITGIDPGPTGPNTGGMGAYSPAPVVTDAVYKKVMKRIINPVVKAMESEEIPFTGVVYAGLMIKDGNPYVLEFNVRFGDPETQPQLMRMESDLVECMLVASEGRLKRMKGRLKWDKRPAVCVVMASGGYPGIYEKGKLIKGIETASGMRDVAVFEAGTTHTDDGKTYTGGGRVLGVTALGEDIADAQDEAYKAVSKISFDKMFYRTDIANKAINR